MDRRTLLSLPDLAVLSLVDAILVAFIAPSLFTVAARAGIELGAPGTATRNVLFTSSPFALALAFVGVVASLGAIAAWRRNPSFVIAARVLALAVLVWIVYAAMLPFTIVMTRLE